MFKATQSLRNKLRNSCGPNDPLENCDFLRESHLNLIQELPGEDDNGVSHNARDILDAKKEPDCFKMPTQLNCEQQSAYAFDQNPLDFFDTFERQQANYVCNQLPTNQFLMQNPLPMDNFMECRPQGIQVAAPAKLMMSDFTLGSD